MPGLHNVRPVTGALISGSSPEGDEGFQTLAELGVKTVISVDGARPDVERARRFGMRYVHLPVGYDGVPRDQILRIARAVRDLPGTVYIHCHHGKHRGPASAIVARRCLDASCTAADALEFLRQAGTDPHYCGLFASAEGAAPVDPKGLDTVPADFPESAAVAALVEAMVQIDGRWDHLKEIRTAAWNVPPNHADLDPPHEALQLRELFHEASRLPDVQAATEPFRGLFADAESAVRDLETALRRKDGTAAEAAFRRSQDLCNRCHEQFRDTRDKRR